MIDIETLKPVNKSESYVITEHARIRMNERGIAIKDIVHCIDSGEIIEQYEDDKPFPSCLVFGKSVGDRYLHVAVSYDEEFIYLITAYYPNSEKWEDDFKTRKEH